MVGMIILVFGFVFACLASWGWPNPVRPHLGWLALACLIAYLLFGDGVRLLH
jgi:hypothetical protein